MLSLLFLAGALTGQRKKHLPETDLERRLKLIAYQGGGDLFGVADLAPAREFIIAQGGKALAGFPRAVTIGMRLSDVIVDQHSPEEKREDSLY